VVEPIVLDKAISCFTGLSPTEKILTAAAPFFGGTVIWRFAFKKGHWDGEHSERKRSGADDLTIALRQCQISHIDISIKTQEQTQHIKAAAETLLRVPPRRFGRYEVTRNSSRAFPPAQNSLQQRKIECSSAFAVFHGSAHRGRAVPAIIGSTSWGKRTPCGAPSHLLRPSAPPASQIGE
jgi:hypothetical protein